MINYVLLSGFGPGVDADCIVTAFFQNLPGILHNQVENSLPGMAVQLGVHDVVSDRVCRVAWCPAGSIPEKEALVDSFVVTSQVLLHLCLLLCLFIFGESIDPGGLQLGIK